MNIIHVNKVVVTAQIVQINVEITYILSRKDQINN